MIMSTNMDELLFSRPKLNYSPFSDLSERIAKKYEYRPLRSTDPMPIKLNCDTDGPLTINKESIMCNLCGSIIRKNYLTNHRESGACVRLAEKREQEYNYIPRSQTIYNGPYVNLKNSDDIINQSLNKIDD